MTPTAPLLALSCQACDISGKEMSAALHSGDLSEGPEPLDQLSSPGGSTSGEEKTGSSLHHPPPGWAALPLASTVLPQAGVPWEAAV